MTHKTRDLCIAFALGASILGLGSSVWANVENRLDRADRARQRAAMVLVLKALDPDNAAKYEKILDP